jgi:RNA polymerase sigma-70 factor (ECF subfamily)
MMDEPQRHLDAELVARWRQGEPAAFEALLRRWQQPVARFLTRLLGQPDPAADLCQEVFLRVFLAGPRYREQGAFSTWLYRIALNVARDAGRRARLPLEPLPEPGPAAGATPVDVCERRELAQAVTQALAELPEALREVLVLRHYEDMNFEEMARVLGTPASTLKSRFATALTRLRMSLQQRGWSLEAIR